MRKFLFAAAVVVVSAIGLALLLNPILDKVVQLPRDLTVTVTDNPVEITLDRTEVVVPQPGAQFTISMENKGVGPQYTFGIFAADANGAPTGKRLAKKGIIKNQTVEWKPEGLQSGEYVIVIDSAQNDPAKRVVSAKFSIAVKQPAPATS